METNLWEFKYKPKVFDDLILNDDIKPILKKNLKERPNMLIYGSPGVGKGSYVDVLINHNNLQHSVLKINASMELNIETMRQDVKTFAQTMSFENDLKLVYLNEIDTSTLLNVQKSLRQLIEDTQSNCRFILVCNYIENIIPELKSRCQVYEINKPPAIDIFKKCVYILKNENIEYDKNTIFELIKKCYPDIRNTLITLRKNIKNGVLQKNIELSSSEKIFDEILNGIVLKNPDIIRKILKSNSIFYPALYDHLYKKIMDSENDVFKNDAEAILLIGEHLYRDSICNIKEINFMTMVFHMIKNGVV